MNESEGNSPLETKVPYFSKTCFTFVVGRAGIFGGVYAKDKIKV